MSGCRDDAGKLFKLFHILGPATGKLLSPRRVYVRGATKTSVSAERSWRRPELAMTGSRPPGTTGLDRGATCRRLRWLAASLEASEDNEELVRCNHVASHLWEGAPPRSELTANCLRVEIYATFPFPVEILKQCLVVAHENISGQSAFSADITTKVTSPYLFCSDHLRLVVRGWRLATMAEESPDLIQLPIAARFQPRLSSARNRGMKRLKIMIFVFSPLARGRQHRPGLL